VRHQLSSPSKGVLQLNLIISYDVAHKQAPDGGRKRVFRAHTPIRVERAGG